MPRYLSRIRITLMTLGLLGLTSLTVLAAEDTQLVGTWRTRIVIPGAPTDFFAVEVFHAGGTMTDVFAGGLIPVGAPSAAHSVSSGVWEKLPGPGNFAATLEGFLDTDANGFFDQRVQVRLTIQVLDHDRFTATATNQALSLDGSAPRFPPVRGITVQGTRMLLIRE